MKGKGKKKNGHGSLKKKFLTLTIPVVSILIGTLVIITTILCRNSLKEVSEELLDASAIGQKNMIEAWLEGNLSTMEAVKEVIQDETLSEKKLKKLLDLYYNYNSDYTEGFYIGTNEGELITASQSSKQEANVLESNWYQQGLTRVNLDYGSIHTNNKEENIISASGIINDGSDNIRVLSADISLDKVNIIVNSAIEMNDASSFLVDISTNQIISHKDSNLVLTEFDTSNTDAVISGVAKKLANKDYSIGTIDSNLVDIQSIENTEWVLVSYVPTESIYKSINILTEILILCGVIFIVILAILIERVSHYTFNPIKTFTGLIGQMSSGDFTMKIEAKGNNEITEMSLSLMQLVDSMKKMLSGMSKMSSDLRIQASDSNKLSGGLLSISENQSQSMAALNDTVDELVKTVNEIAENASMLAMAASDTKTASSSLQNKMEDTILVSQSGKSEMAEADKAMAQISDVMKELKGAIYKVGTASKEINEIVNVISDITDETNLLALNASIEAARAGDAGKGFSVVADEIGKLANTSAKEVKTINEIIKKISDLVDNAVNQAEESVSSIDESSSMIRTAVRSFENIYLNIEETGLFVQQMISKVNEVDEVATNVAAISEEQAAGAELILNTSEQMVEQAKKITEYSQNIVEYANVLDTSSDTLAQEVNVFKID